jgi:hypothetical protein
MPGAWQFISSSAQRRRRGIFVEPRTKMKFSPVGAAYSAPTELGLFFDFMFYKYVSPTGFTPER